MSIPFIERGGTLTLYLKDQMISVGPDHKSYLPIKEALKTGSEDEIWRLYHTLEMVGKEMEEATSGKIVFDTRTRSISFMGQTLHSSIVDKALEFLDGGLPYQPLLKFLERLMENPSASSVRELYDFLENKHLPITEDGCFLAYKAVKEDWTDKHTGKILNKLGTEVSIPRNQVDDTREHECSFGLHVGAHDYVKSFGYGSDRFLIVKVDPKDCVSVPKDHSAQKLRVCKYTVLSQVSAETILSESPLYQTSPEERYTPACVNDYDDDYAYWDYDNDYLDEDEPEPFELQPVVVTSKSAPKEVEDVWVDWTRDEVVAEAWDMGLIRTKEEGRRMGKEKVCSLLEDHGVQP